MVRSLVAVTSKVEWCHAIVSPNIIDAKQWQLARIGRFDAPSHLGKGINETCLLHLAIIVGVRRLIEISTYDNWAINWRHSIDHIIKFLTTPLKTISQLMKQRLAYRIEIVRTLC